MDRTGACDDCGANYCHCIADTAAAQDTPPTGPDAAGAADIEAIAAAIDAADHGYSIRLTSLTDEGSVYTLDLCDGSEPLTFNDADDAREHAMLHRSLARARAALAALAALPAASGAGEDSDAGVRS